MNNKTQIWCTRSFIFNSYRNICSEMNMTFDFYYNSKKKNQKIKFSFNFSMNVTVQWINYNKNEMIIVKLTLNELTITTTNSWIELFHFHSISLLTLLKINKLKNLNWMRPSRLRSAIWLCSLIQFKIVYDIEQCMACITIFNTFYIQ